MAKYKVLRPIQYNRVFYFPAGQEGTELVDVGDKDGPIRADRSGVIELKDSEAKALVHGQIPLHEGKPDALGMAEARAELAAKKAAEEKAEAEAKARELQEFQEFKKRKTSGAAKSKD